MRDRLLIGLVILAMTGGCTWAAHVGTMRECRAAVADGSYPGPC